MFQPNVEETGTTSNLLLTGRISVLRRGVETGNLSTGKIKCKLSGQCNCCSCHYLIAHKSHTGLHSHGVKTEKQLHAIRSSDVYLNATITCEAWGSDGPPSRYRTPLGLLSPLPLPPSCVFVDFTRSTSVCASGLRKGIKKKETDVGVFNTCRC